MNVEHRVLMAVLIAALGAVDASAQISSLGAKKRRIESRKLPEAASREAPKIQRNAVYEAYSWITVKHVPPKRFKVGDLLTIIVRETRKFEADADLKTKKQFDIKSELEAFLKLTGGGIGATAFRRGKPTVDYKYSTDLKTKGDTQREDRLTTRLTGRIIDVKPNGLLVIEARATVQHDEEISAITVTGICRKEDVTADNTILSTQVADKNIVVLNEGALRAVTTRGWIPKLIDLLSPF